MKFNRRDRREPPRFKSRDVFSRRSSAVPAVSLFKATLAPIEKILVAF